MNLSKVLQRLGPGVLPFADAASDDLPFSRLLRLGLFQVSVGLILALLAGTLNRVMIVEMAIAAVLVAAFIAAPMVSAPIRAVFGHKSDHHRSAFGWRRVPYLWFGTFLTTMGLALIPVPLILLNGVSEYGPWARLFGLCTAGLAFVVVGIGAHAVQTAGLALATDQAPEEKRPRVVSFLYVNFLVGMLIGGLGYSLMLRSYSNLALIRVVSSTAVLTLILNVIALWRQESADPERAARLKNTAAPPFREAWAKLTAHRDVRRFLWAIGIGAAGFAMQDVLLEPYGGQLMGMGVSGTSLLTALSAVGALLAFGLAARWLPRGTPTLALAAAGSLVGAAAFGLILFAPVLGSVLLLYFGAFLLGFGGGFFTVGSLTAAMRLQRISGSGLAVGAWGAVYSLAGGLALGAGGAIRDLVIRVWPESMMMSGLSPEAAGYMLVYHLEVLALFVAVALLGPIALRWDGGSTSRSTDTPEPLGLAELPG